MGTRSVIARPTGEGWAGRYCHADGYPDHQGRVLFGAATDQPDWHPSSPATDPPGRGR